MNLLSGMQKRILACGVGHPAIHCQSRQAGGYNMRRYAGSAASFAH
jgi:hypothetical protein